MRKVAMRFYNAVLCARAMSELVRTTKSNVALVRAGRWRRVVV